MRKILIAVSSILVLSFPVSAQQFGAGLVCVGPLAKEQVNHVRMSREGCDWAVAIALDGDSWLWTDGWITAQTAYVWQVGEGSGAQHALGRYQHEVGVSYDDKGTVILACASGGPRLGRGSGWIGMGLGICMFTGTDGLGAPMLAPTIPIRAHGSVFIGDLRLGIRPHIDLILPLGQGTTVFQEWSYCPRGTIGSGNGCDFKETGNDWRMIIAVYLTVND